MVTTRRKLFQILLSLILLTIVVNGLFSYIRGSILSSSENDGGSGEDIWDGWGGRLPPVIQNKSVHSIRFKVETCDTDASSDELLLLVGTGVNPRLVEIAQRIRLKYSEMVKRSDQGWQDNGKNTGSRPRGRGFLPPPQVTRLQRLLTPVPQSVKKNSTPSTKGAIETPVWKSIHEWPFSDSLRLVTLGQVLTTAATSGIRSATSAARGTQMKVELILAGGQVALWKPKAYSRDVVLEGTPYTGKDRHYGEIASFYLNLLLGYNNAPISTGRLVNLQTELLPVATPHLKETFFTDSNGSLCFFGVCHFCTKSDPVCQPIGFRTEVEGALVLWMQKKYKTVPNPWRRTYQSGVQAPWEVSMNFCTQLLRDIPRINRAQMILDIVAVSVFDFLIGNGDRHNLEMLLKMEPDFSSHTNKILLMDNGKSFGNPTEDYLDILAPLFQCCKIRKSLYSTLKTFEGKLGSWLELITKGEPLYPLLTQANLRALDRRLKIVISTVNYCKDVVQRHNSQQKNPNLHKKLFYHQA